MSQTLISSDKISYNAASEKINRKRKRSVSKRKVHFSLDKTTYLQAAPASTMTELERSKIWYLPHEIDYFRSSHRQNILCCDINNIEPCYVEDEILNNDTYEECKVK